MSLSTVTVTPDLVILTSTGATDRLLSVDVTTGVVTSLVLPESITNYLTLRLQGLLAADAALAATAIIPKLLWSMLLMDRVVFGLPIVSTIANVGGNIRAVDVTLGLNDRVYLAVGHVFSQPFMSRSISII